MSNTFKTLCQSCGFKMMEAADFLAVSPNTAKSWWLGTRTCPDGAINELRALFTMIDRAAEEHIAQQIKERGNPPELIQIGLACDDHEAQSLGLPNVAAHAAMLRRVIERLPPEYAALIEIVPLGSTPETAAAADAHGK